MYGRRGPSDPSERPYPAVWRASPQCRMIRETPRDLAYSYLSAPSLVYRSSTVISRVTHSCPSSNSGYGVTP
jgi:hypothetical protein